jgi:hypothetical protein
MPWTRETINNKPFYVAREVVQRIRWTVDVTVGNIGLFVWRTTVKDGEPGGMGKVACWIEGFHRPFGEGFDGGIVDGWKPAGPNLIE